MLTIFLQKAQNFVRFGPYDFVQISPAYMVQILIKLYGEPLDFQCQHQQHKVPDQKINFCSKFAIKTLPCYRQARSQGSAGVRRTPPICQNVHF